MTDDIHAISGEEGGYVPCVEVPLAQPASGQDASAAYGEDEGFVSKNVTALAQDADATDTSAVFGRAAGFVPGPCELDCDITKDYTDIDLATTWKPQTSLFRKSHVADGSPPSGPATFFDTDGPFWETPVGIGDTLSGAVVPSWVHLGFPGDPWTIQEAASTKHLSWSNELTRPYIRVTGDLIVGLAWAGGGTTEAEPVAPAITWELCLDNYGSLVVTSSAFHNPAVATLDDLYFEGGGYFPSVVGTGTNGLGTYPINVTFDNPGTTYVQLMLRISNDTPETVAVFDRAFDTPALAAYAWPRYPAYLTDNSYRTLAGSGGMQVTIDNFALTFCQ